MSAAETCSLQSMFKKDLLACPTYFFRLAVAKKFSMALMHDIWDGKLVGQSEPNDSARPTKFVKIVNRNSPEIFPRCFPHCLISRTVGFYRFFKFFFLVSFCTCGHLYLNLHLTILVFKYKSWSQWNSLARRTKTFSETSATISSRFLIYVLLMSKVFYLKN